MHASRRLRCRCEIARARRKEWGIDKVTTDWEQICADQEIDAVVIATPNFTHRPIAVAAAKAGKHVMCEKPLGLNAGEVREMYIAARDAGVVHMTAFTYRFAPAMRYLRHLLKTGALGQPRHFRSQRFLDWPETSWAWRQYKDKAGAGDLFDMTIHRIDFAIDLLGPIKSVCGAVAQIRRRTTTADGKTCPPSDVDDWSSLIGEFANGADRRLGRHDAGQGLWPQRFRPRMGGNQRLRAIGGLSIALAQYHSIGQNWQRFGAASGARGVFQTAGSPRDPKQGEPATVFRYDLMWEFVSAIVEGRDAVPSFYDGLNAQLVADCRAGIARRAPLDRHASWRKSNQSSVVCRNRPGRAGG